jgi:uncharacterized protein YkwD
VIAGRFFFWLLPAAFAAAGLACWAEQPERAESPEVPAHAPVHPSAQTDERTDPTAVMLEVINAERGEGPPLEVDPLLWEVVQEYTEELTDLGSFPEGDTSEEILGRLNDHGYKAYRVVLSLAQLSGPAASAVVAWRRSDPESFERLRHPELRDFALGMGQLGGTPFYVAVGAVRQSEHYAEQSAELRRDLEKARQEELRLVNEVRAQRKLAPLRRHPSLDLAAQSYAEDMLRRGFYGHLSPEGEDVSDRVKAAGYAYRKVGENVASGQSSLQVVMAGWVESPGHLANMADPYFREIGLGFAAGPSRDGGYAFLWVQVFAQPRR